MSKCKKENNLDFSKLPEIFSALSNPNRLEIFSTLASCCKPGTKCNADEEYLSSCVGELGRDMEIAPSTLSHHVKELNRAGLIQMKRKGKKVECWIDPNTIESLSIFFRNFLEK